MNFIEFQNNFRSYDVFSVHEIEKFYPNFNKINLQTWQKKTYIFKLKNGLYRLNNINDNDFDTFVAANKIYAPSYISLETALSYYGVIPEAVFSLTSVTTLKTNRFNNQVGHFTYHNIKPAFFFGYRLLKNKRNSRKIAELEKSILDFLYLKSSVKTTEDINSMRFNKFVLQKELNLQKLNDYCSFMKSKILSKKTAELHRFLDA